MPKNLQLCLFVHSGSHVGAVAGLRWDNSYPFDWSVVLKNLSGPSYDPYPSNQKRIKGKEEELRGRNGGSYTPALHIHIGLEGLIFVSMFIGKVLSQWDSPHNFKLL